MVPGKRKYGRRSGGGFKDFCDFHPDFWGEDSQFDEHIFQMGWFNHQLGGEISSWLNIFGLPQKESTKTI